MRIGPRGDVQRAFVACSADWACFGGAAGSGKSAAVAIDPLRYVRHDGWRGVMFRRKAKDHGQGGGTWDIARSLWGPTGAHFRLAPTRQAEWRGAAGARVEFQYPELGSNYETQFQGLQAAWLGFDEWTHFDWPFVSYVHGRMRTPLRVPLHVRGSCNPDPDSWLLHFVEWYLDGEGYPRRDRSGAVRYWARHSDSDELVHGPTRADVRRRARVSDERVWSFAFFPATAADNAWMLERDPDYADKYAAAVASTRVREERLVRGNWYAREDTGGMLARERWDLVRPDDVPQLVGRVRCWDRAATLPSEANPDPDYTASALCGWDVNGHFWAALGPRGITALRDTPGKVATHMRLTALDDGPTVTQRIPIDPGAAGKDSVEWTRQRMAGQGIGPLDFWPQRGSKTVRAQPLSEALEQGRCHLVLGPWADQTYRDPKVSTTLLRLLWSQLDPFPDGGSKAHKDFADALAGAYLARRTPLRYVGGLAPSNLTRGPWRG